MSGLPERRAALELRTVQTVRGPVPASQLGHVQLHEHFFCDLNAYGLAQDSDEPITLSNVYRVRVDNSQADDLRLDDLEAAQQEAQRYRQLGGGTVVDATSRGLGRDPEGLAEVARASGVNVVMGAGWYVAPFHAARVARADVDELAAEMVADATEGADGTGIRSGILGEIGLSWPPHPDEEKTLRAAALAQQQTGLPILVHPGRDERAPAAHLALLAESGADLTRTIVSHIDRTVFDVDAMVALASDFGAVLEFDLFGDESSYYPPNPGIDRPNDGTRVRWIKALVDRGLVDQISISQDICRKTRLTRWGGEGYGHILERVIPLMLARGIDAEAMEIITRIRPAELLSTPTTEPR